MLDTTPISIPFDPQRPARAIRVRPDTAPEAALAALDLPPFQAIVVVHGGAGSMEPAFFDPIRRFLAASLVPVAEAKRVLVVDGATRVGIARLLGETRHQAGGTYPLLGLCPSGKIAYPGGPRLDANRAPLDPWHSHFLFVEGDAFGVESPLMVSLLRASGRPGLALIINGGAIVYQEVQAHAAQGNRIVTVRGSGRVADELADPSSEKHQAIAAGVPLEVVDIRAPATFAARLATWLA